ncbi:MAG: cytidylate kinase [Bdellovibrionales bacterium RIFOXYD12_FULL_39_22]|nr:MAG: cytidylate kinase [Bdellovibrionales bacterium RIFOXYB1_FULL_39_21]OFZ40870.1 MAG: cytidylate kinase [Bdellovibrionales bacterium RIFOXYC12_FULL_39_17]OFZ44411.1 MAG: cytidylate kinase [Bdellovibrionales bacterium RIFOXYC1_FULL_39_130]OFZ71876.1 MAG: cytidylate kinase [Bdellovibrionales bacterium RIFOXYC2_FULL_39_8]OFZ74158.1 MAG: cytidylate kinase [Bdellovibrionales bacterium RIFOXYD1_FULL_39_84]OFZ92007.1 MAG: cytidylate kinase [Bdellovibrionales bacterium RIFOXYD12_FULL_39_22]HLE12
MSKSNVIAIDGPCGGGKSSVAKAVATGLKILYVDTGAMFRALGLVCSRRGIAFEEGPTMRFFLNNIRFNYGRSEECLVEIDGDNLTEPIREHSVSDLASKVSQIGSVRTFLKQVQKDLVLEKVCIMEGRDIGTVVFPMAFCKIYLTATPEIRAQRRYDQLMARGGSEIDFQKVLQDLKTRDHNDMNREIAPLKQAEDAFLLDSSGLTFEQVVEKIKQVARERAIIEKIKL